MYKTVPGILFCLFLGACGAPAPVGPNGPLSKTQQAGIQAVSTVFESPVQYEEKINQTQSGSKERYFLLQLDSLSNTMRPFISQPDMLATNAANLFYQKLSESERASLTHIQVKWQNPGERPATQTVQTLLLNSLAEELALADTAMNKLVQKDYPAFFALMRTPLSPKLKRVSIDQMLHTDSIFGGMKSYKPLGFKILQESDGTLYSRFYSLQIREKRPLPFSMDFSRQEGRKLMTYLFEHQF